MKIMSKASRDQIGLRRSVYAKGKVLPSCYQTAHKLSGCLGNNEQLGLLFQTLLSACQHSNGPLCKEGHMWFACESFTCLNVVLKVAAIPHHHVRSGQGLTECLRPWTHRPSHCLCECHSRFWQADWEWGCCLGQPGCGHESIRWNRTCSQLTQTRHRCCWTRTLKGIHHWLRTQRCRCCLKKAACGICSQ